MQCPDCDLSLESRVVEYSPMGKSALSVCPNCARVSIERQIFGPVTDAQSKVRPRQSEVGIDPVGLHVEPRAGKNRLRDVTPQSIKVMARGRSYIGAPVTEIEAVADTDLAADW
jgi:hypothetical protein